jgi:diadenosine tetraphosphate (Ap4A) HIT family hydrolase
MTNGSWPADWEQRLAGHDCALCASVGLGDDEYTVGVAELPYSEVRLERRSRLPGYCIVVWKQGHVAEPTELDRPSAAGYWNDVLEVGRAIQAVFAPVKLNFLTLGNLVPHLHTHVLGRYRDDPAPGGPIEWTQIFSPEPIAATTLRSQAEALRRLLASPGRAS